jgi:hypothetical protein
MMAGSQLEVRLLLHRPQMRLAQLMLVMGLALAVAPRIGAAAEEPAVPLSLRLDFARANLSLHEPVVPVLEIANGTGGTIHLDLGKNFMSGLAVSIRNPSGHIGAGQLPPEPPDGIYLPGTVALQSGQTYRQTLVLNDWYAFGTVGSYAITVSLPVAPQPLVPAPMTLSATVVLEILPRDVALLTATCTELATRAVKGNVEIAMVAGDALSYATDEACLASLARVASDARYAKYEALRGLARIGTPGAVEAVVSAWDGLDSAEKSNALADFQILGGSDAVLRKALANAGKSLPPAIF